MTPPEPLQNLTPEESYRRDSGRILKQLESSDERDSAAPLRYGLIEALRRVAYNICRRDYGKK